MLRVIFSLFSEINSVALCSELFLSLWGRINSLAWGQFRVNPQERLVEIIRSVNSKAGYVFTRFSNTKCAKTTLLQRVRRCVKRSEAVTKVTTCQGRLTQVWSDVNPRLSDWEQEDRKRWGSVSDGLTKHYRHLSQNCAATFLNYFLIKPHRGWAGSTDRKSSQPWCQVILPSHSLRAPERMRSGRHKDYRAGGCLPACHLQLRHW